MITDPKTAPRSPSARLVYAVSLGVLASVLIAPTTTEFAAKVALLGALAIVCVGDAAAAARPALVRPAAARSSSRPRSRAAAAVAIVLASPPSAANAFRPLPPGALPPITILPSHGVQTAARPPHGRAHRARPARGPARDDEGRVARLARAGPRAGAADGDRAARRRDVPPPPDARTGTGRSPATTKIASAPVPTSDALAGTRLTNVAPSVGLDFRQGSFRFGMSNETQAMMGGGVCWLDYNGDGWQDLFAVNSYASADTAQWQAHGGLPRSALFENVHGRFRNVTAAAHAGLQVQGDGCAAADLTGNGRPDLVVTTTRGVDVLWNNGNGTFTTTRPARAGLVHGHRRRRRQRGRPARHLRRRLLRHERTGSGLALGLPDERRGRPRPPLPERGAPALPRSRRTGGARVRELQSRPRRRVRRRQRRRSPGSVRRERRGSEPAVRERALAGRREGRPRGPRLPLRGSCGRERRRRSVRGHGHRVRERNARGDELARRADRRVPARRARRSRTRDRSSTRRSAPASPAGVRRGSTSRTPESPTSCSPPERFR